MANLSAKQADAILAACPQVRYNLRAVAEQEVTDLEAALRAVREKALDDDYTAQDRQTDVKDLEKKLGDARARRDATPRDAVEIVPWIGAGPPPADRLVREAGEVRKPVKRVAPIKVAAPTEPLASIQAHGERWDAAKIASALAKMAELEKLLHQSRLELDARTCDLAQARAREQALGEQVVKAQSEADRTAPALAVTVDGTMFTAEMIRLLRNCEREASHQMQREHARAEREEGERRIVQKLLDATRRDLEREKLEHDRTKQALAAQKELVAKIAAKTDAPVATPVVAGQVTKIPAPRVRIVG